MLRILAVLALVAGLSSHAWAASDGTEPDPVLAPGAVEAPPMAKKAKRKPRNQAAAPVFIEGAGTVWVCAWPPSQR